MAIKTITSVDDLYHPNPNTDFGKYKYDFYNCMGGLFVVLVRGGQEHDRDRLSLLVLERYDCKERGVVFRWKNPIGSWGFGHEVSEKNGGWVSAIGKGIDAYGGVVFHLSNPMVDMITLLNHCVQNNLDLQVSKVRGFNYGRPPIQDSDS
jgi:hypothetical protein